MVVPSLPEAWIVGPADGLDVVDAGRQDLLSSALVADAPRVLHEVAVGVALPALAVAPTRDGGTSMLRTQTTTD